MNVVRKKVPRLRDFFIWGILNLIGIYFISVPVNRHINMLM